MRVKKISSSSQMGDIKVFSVLRSEQGLILGGGPYTEKGGVPKPKNA